jgi:hypothetical protein
MTNFMLGGKHVTLDEEGRTVTHSDEWSSKEIEFFRRYVEVKKDGKTLTLGKHPSIVLSDLVRSCVTNGLKPLQ